MTSRLQKIRMARGTNQYKRKPRKRAIFLAFMLIALTWLYLVTTVVNTVMPISHADAPKANMTKPYSITSPTPTPTQLDKQASWIAKYAQEYARPEIGKTKSLVTYQLACLAHKENGFHSNDHCGDSGLACGEYQFHQATWIAFRQEMMKQGLVGEIGSRLNDQQATETTAWAITHGHDNDWGPLLRGECQ